ncbi:ClbS/DfsB family four-helix bundle protein [Ktedonosporobacter rubrisoli]|uniref:ClbS/DfsB family four-helix bundle protein n=2 Tax=Ktedonosporobacter rubrisoli TaxID=2509675 RepID=A0A4V0YYD2_KTERU|nr:ClbS/DfsB family four-helix bundle protein [Ktedonosporobacter rubrisoli]
MAQQYLYWKEKRLKENTMPETGEKVEILTKIQTGYAQFETLLASLSEEQMTIPNVNSNWSVKDNIAHITAWQDYLVEQLQGIMTGKKPSQFLPDLSLPDSLSGIDEINEGIYKKYKDRPLAEVLAAFRASYQRVLEAVRAMSEESLNVPPSWGTKNDPDWLLIASDDPARFIIASNTYEHYKEHSDIIQHWLQR